MKSGMLSLALAIAVLASVFAWYAWRVETRLSYIEPCALLGKLELQRARLAKIDRGDGFGEHLDAFAEELKRGRKALYDNDLAAATEALRRADREAQWLYEHEERRQEEARRQEEEAFRQALSTGGAYSPCRCLAV